MELIDQNYYEILEVSQEATPQDVERAYRIARATYQPASTATYSIFSDEENGEILRRVDEAFAVLSDSRMRREYDARLRRERSPDTPRTPVRAEPVIEPVPPPVRAPAPPTAAAAAPASASMEQAGGPGSISQRAASWGGIQGPSISFDETEEPDNGVYNGATLRRIRIQRGIELEEIASVTKINETYLRFIEADRYADLPAPVYLRGFLREVARCLKLDATQVIDSYMQCASSTQ